jgi:hypothetical protein
MSGGFGDEEEFTGIKKMPRGRSRAASSHLSNVRSRGGGQSVAWEEEATAYEYADSVYPSSSRGGDIYSDDGDEESYYDEDDDGGYEENDYWDDDETGDDQTPKGAVPRYVPPRVKLAERHAQRVNPQHALDSPLRVAPDDLNEYGIGVVLYFTFLRLLVIAFALLTLLAVPLAMGNISGDALGQSEDPLSVVVETTSLGNYGRLYSWTRGGIGSNATEDALAGAPPPVAVDGVNRSSAETLQWEHGPALTVDVLGAGKSAGGSSAKDEINVILSYIDLLLLAGFAVFALALGPIQQRLAKAVDRNMTTIEDYSVLVRDIPKDALDPQELWKFFGKRVGTVVDVQIAHNDSELLGLAFERGRISEQLDRAMARWKKAVNDPTARVEVIKRIESEGKRWKKDLRATNAAIRQLQNERGSGSQSICAYVTFQDEEAFLQCLKLYRPGVLAWLLRPQGSRLRGTHRLRVTQAPAPTDIQWENLEFTWLQRAVRSVSVSALTVGILVLAFMAITAIKQLKEGTTVSYDQGACRQSCAYELTPKLSLTNLTIRGTYAECFKREAHLDPPPAPPAPSPPPVSIGRRRRRAARHLLQTATTATTATDAAAAATTAATTAAAAAAAGDWTNFTFNASSVVCGPSDAFCFSCYCLEHITASSILRERGYCKPYVEGYSMQLIAGGAAQGVIVIMNTFLKQFIVRIVRYERHHSASSEQKSVMRKLFLAQFFNTAVNIVVISMALPWLKRVIKGTAAAGLLFQGDLDDLTPKWYQEVGYALVLSMIVTPMSQCAQMLLRHWAFQYKRSGARSSAVTQRQLNQAYEGAEFAMSVRYGEILNIVFVTMTFCSGVPVLVPFAFFSFLVHYTVDKFDFLRVSKLPPSFSTTLAEGAAEVLAYAAIGHLLFAMWANSFYRMDADPFVYGLVGAYLERFAEMWWGCTAVEFSVPIA